MPYRLLADLVVLVHLAFIAFAVLGGLLALRWRWIPWLHLPAALWACSIVLGGWICPLTPLENGLRRAAGSGSYEGGFIDHYIVPLIYPVDLTRDVQIAYGLLGVAINVAIYAVIVRRARTAAKAPGDRMP